jgi:polysaccharide biosynthesis/export protein
VHTTRSHLSFFLAVSLSAMCAGTALAQVDTSERNPRYRLQPSDVLEIHYRYTPEFDQTVTLSPDGFVTLQIVGDLKLRGLTMEEVKAAILDKARRRLNEPEVNLVLKDFEKPYFVVGGEVGTPGRFEMRGTITAVQAIAMAGGFKSSSKHSQVVLFRKVNPGLFRTELLDLKAAMTGSAEAPNIELLPGDMLMVPQNRISKIERFVKWASFGVYFNPIGSLQ